jgi:hypothetical protein
MSTVVIFLLSLVILGLTVYIYTLQQKLAAANQAVKEEAKAHEKYWDRLRSIPIAGSRFKLEGVGEIHIIGHNFEEGFIEYCLAEDFDTRDPQKGFEDVDIISNDLDNFVARAEHALALM